MVRRLAAWYMQRALNDRIGIPSSPQSNMALIVDEPSEAEKQQRRLIHLSNKAWYIHWVQHKVRSDCLHPADPTRRGTAVVSYDFSYTSRDEDGEAKLVALAVYDRHMGERINTGSSTWWLWL